MGNMNCAASATSIDNNPKSNNTRYIELNNTLNTTVNGSSERTSSSLSSFVPLIPAIKLKSASLSSYNVRSSFCGNKINNNNNNIGSALTVHRYNEKNLPLASNNYCTNSNNSNKKQEKNNNNEIQKGKYF
ncbi:unnamed protein product [Didymodactylos carnosus]|uniref:Uncharacterized protein n=1 Tax=Didymodactylos carnosus TaxID=1234261 RepID=A0A814K507_9BILA|nr:unnamed protein product [Didymodactylos carnosus]CAF3814569.1 unnamed protein product [Didymodactylos carnosus]